jgi:hypothetical protein
MRRGKSMKKIRIIKMTNNMKESKRLLIRFLLNGIPSPKLRRNPISKIIFSSNKLEEEHMVPFAKLK